MNRTCLFCSRPATRNQEDMAVLVQALDGPQGTTWTLYPHSPRQRRSTRPGRKQKQIDRGTAAHRVQKSNEGWMGTLQDRGSRISKPMLSVGIGPASAAIDAYPFGANGHQRMDNDDLNDGRVSGMATTDRTYFAQAEREQFRAERVPPPNSVISSAQVVGSAAVWARLRSSMAPVFSHDDAPTGESKHVYTTTLAMWQVALELVHCRELENPVASRCRPGRRCRELLACRGGEKMAAR